MTRVPGFQFAGMSAGIKPSNALDLGLIACERPVTAAGVFTKNLVRAAAVDVAEERVKAGRLQAVIVNSGNANACTGRKGERAVISAAQSVAKALDTDAKFIAPASTGVIGVPLPERVIDQHAESLVAALSPDGAARFAEAIMTTDRGPKMAVTKFKVGHNELTVLGIAKGAGMIHPNMATTLAFVMTDAPVRRPFLRKALRDATDETFNRITVDGDTSTNDTLLALASGEADVTPIDGKGASGNRFVLALSEVLDELGQMIVADGEGTQHLVRIEVKGAPDEAAGLRVARTVATSQLVKTALHGCDPNWGRILAAAGRAAVVFDPNKVEIRIGSVAVYKRGTVAMDSKTEREAAAVMKQDKYTIEINLGAGRGRAHYWTCDLGHDYVSLNADYRS